MPQCAGRSSLNADGAGLCGFGLIAEGCGRLGECTEFGGDHGPGLVLSTPRSGSLVGSCVGTGASSTSSRESYEMAIEGGGRHRDQWSAAGRGTVARACFGGP